MADNDTVTIPTWMFRTVLDTVLQHCDTQPRADALAEALRIERGRLTQLAAAVEPHTCSSCGAIVGNQDTHDWWPNVDSAVRQAHGCTATQYDYEQALKRWKALQGVERARRPRRRPQRGRPRWHVG
jgi:hypothetical protein